MADGPHGPRVFISYVVEKQLSDFLATELDLQLRLGALSRQLETKPDWNPHSAFRLIDRGCDGLLNYGNIQAFLRDLGHYASDQQVIAIVRRFDSDADQVVRMQEFIEMVTPRDRRAVDPSTNLTAVIARGRDSPQRVRIGAGGRVSPIRPPGGSPLRSTAAKSVHFRDEPSPAKPSILIRKSVSAARIGGSPLRPSPPRGRLSPYSNSPDKYRITRPVDIARVSPVRHNASPLRSGSPPKPLAMSPTGPVPIPPYVGINANALHEKYRDILDLER